MELYKPSLPMLREAFSSSSFKPLSWVTFFIPSVTVPQSKKGIENPLEDVSEKEKNEFYWLYVAKRFLNHSPAAKLYCASHTLFSI